MVKELKNKSGPKVIRFDPAQTNYQPILNGPPESVTMQSGLVILAPGNSVGVHSTEDYEELLALEGQGEAQITGQESLVIGAGVAFYCPPETEHNVVNTGSDPLRYVFVVAKAGG